GCCERGYRLGSKRIVRSKGICGVGSKGIVCHTHLLSVNTCSDCRPTWGSSSKEGIDSGKWRYETSWCSKLARTTKNRLTQQIRTVLARLSSHGWTSCHKGITSSKRSYSCG